MKALKRQLKDFRLYFRCYLKGVSTPNGSSAIWFKENAFELFVLLIGILFFMVNIGGTQGGIPVGVPVAFLLGAAFVAGANARVKPSLMSVAPFSPKQRVVFSYLSAVLTALICTVFYIVVIILFLCIIALIMFIISGENFFAVIVNVPDVSVLSGNYVLFSLFLGIYMWASVYAVSFIPRRLYRNIAITVWLTVTEALLLILVNICDGALSGAGGFVFLADLNVAIDRLALPWLPLLVTGLLAAAAFAASVISSVRFFRTSDL